ncbi:MAG: cytochrome c subunit of flavocytochrome c sulfide dehydrogenase [Gammaproteobacteria bacterium]|nr:cytochrome c subunit of flavocytochrome c sulfide dehydrogenase [Gammaproteobacteria bacterium]
MRKLAGLLTAMVTITLLLVPAAGAHAGDFVDLVKRCEGCHGQDGNSRLPAVPSIAGFSYEGFLNTMDVFRENERIAIEFQRPGEPETVMNDIARSLTDEDVDALAKYFSQRPFLPVRQAVDTELASRGAILHKQQCERCHAHNGAEPVEDAAILAGQWTPYLRMQFNNILTGKRIVPRGMFRRVKKLGQDDIEALLNFYASIN